MTDKIEKLGSGRIDSCKVIKVVAVEFLRGLGTEKDPCRIVRAYYLPNGTLLAEVDDYGKPF